MEWNQLQTFLVAAREENFSKAAELLYTSQPALSKTIKRLEEELGYPLFEREGKRIRLNEFGCVWVETMGQMERMFEETKVRLEEAGGRPHPKVQICVNCASALLPGLLQFLRNRNSEVEYQIFQWNVMNDQQDKSIRILAEKPEREQYDILLEEPIMLAVPAGHGLAEAEEISLKDLEKEEFVSLNSNWELSRTIMRELSKLGFAPKVTMWLDNPNLMRELLRQHMGIAFVPAVTWSSFAGEEVVIRPVKGWGTKRYVYLQMPDSAYLTREQKECAEGIKEYFKQIVLR